MQHLEEICAIAVTKQLRRTIHNHNICIRRVLFLCSTDNLKLCHDCNQMLRSISSAVKSRFGSWSQGCDPGFCPPDIRDLRSADKFSHSFHLSFYISVSTQQPQRRQIITVLYIHNSVKKSSSVSSNNTSLVCTVSTVGYVHSLYSQCQSESSPALLSPHFPSMPFLFLFHITSEK